MNIEEVEKKCYDFYIANDRDKSSLDIILCDTVKIKDNEFDLLKDEYSNDIKSELINKWNKEKPELTKAIQSYSALDINKHYKVGKFDVIDIVNAYNLDFCMGNIVKYACRSKGDDIRSTT